jgi:hypothetical protein
MPIVPQGRPVGSRQDPHGRLFVACDLKCMPFWHQTNTRCADSFRDARSLAGVSHICLSFCQQTGSSFCSHCDQMWSECGQVALLVPEWHAPRAPGSPDAGLGTKRLIWLVQGSSPGEPYLSGSPHRVAIDHDLCNRRMKALLEQAHLPRVFDTRC